MSVDNDLPGVASGGAAMADYGMLAARTSTTVDAAQQTGESFCFPIPPAPHCSEATARWSDWLVFTAPGAVANGTHGSFTAQVAISGQLAAAISSQWSFVNVSSDYTAIVKVDGIVLEQIGASCIAIPGMGCIPVALQSYFGDPPAATMPPSPFGTFSLGPYDFTYSQPFEIEVELRVEALLDATAQSSGVSSASADLNNTLVWVGVVQMFDGPGGTGSAVPLAAARVSPASGADWLETVALPEPGGRLLAVAALGVLVGLRAVRHASVFGEPRGGSK